MTSLPCRAFAAMALGLACPVLAATFTESTDAGEGTTTSPALPITADDITGVGPLVSITGTLTFGSDRVDAYRLSLRQPTSFSVLARFQDLNWNDPGNDTSVFLFDAAGVGQLTNQTIDAFGEGDFRSLLTDPASFNGYMAERIEPVMAGSTTAVGTYIEDGAFPVTLASGDYILAISSGFEQAFDAANNALFPFDFDNLDGRTTLAPLDHWTDVDSLSGTYELRLSGFDVVVVPEPTAGLMLLIAASGLRRRR